MGDIIKMVRICGLAPHGKAFKKGTCKRVKALVDTGASSTVISSQLALDIGAARLPTGASVEDREVPRCLATIHLEATGCTNRPVMPIVDDALARRAGKNLQVILGHDYLQADRAAMRYHGKEGRISAEVACDVPFAKKARVRKAP